MAKERRPCMLMCSSLAKGITDKLWGDERADAMYVNLLQSEVLPWWWQECERSALVAELDTEIGEVADRTAGDY